MYDYLNYGNNVRGKEVEKSSDFCFVKQGDRLVMKPKKDIKEGEQIVSLFGK